MNRQIPFAKRAVTAGRQVGIVLLAVLLCSIATGFAGRGTVQTIDGRTIEGDLTLTNGAIRLTSTNGSVINMALTNLARARFNLAATATAAVPAATNETLPSPWQAGDIGVVRVPGSVSYLSNTFTLRSAGMALGHTNRDSLFFAGRLLKGDGEIVARRA